MTIWATCDTNCPVPCDGRCRPYCATCGSFADRTGRLTCPCPWQCPDGTMHAADEECGCGADPTVPDGPGPLVGYGDEDSDEPSKVDRLRALLVDTAGLDDIEDPEPLVPGVLYRDSLAWMYGAPGCGKSFLAIDIAGCVGTGQHWQGYGPTDTGTVLYVVAEGVSGIKRRVRAWEKAMGSPMSGVSFLPVAVQAGQPDWSVLVELAAELKPALIVIDTQARVTVGMEENSAKDMGVFVNQAERLRKATGACVLVVHHAGRNGDHMRGSIAMDGAATTIIRVTKDEETVTVKCGKQKDTEPFDDIRLRMVQMDDSVILALTDSRPGSQPATSMKWLRTWWDTHKDDPVSVAVLVKSEVVTETTFHRVKHKLMDSGVITRIGKGTATRYVLQAPPDAP